MKIQSSCSDQWDYRNHSNYKQSHVGRTAPLCYCLMLSALLSMCQLKYTAVVVFASFPGLPCFSPLFCFRLLYWTQTEEQNRGGLGRRLGSGHSRCVCLHDSRQERFTSYGLYLSSNAAYAFSMRSFSSRNLSMQNNQVTQVYPTGYEQLSLYKGVPVHCNSCTDFSLWLFQYRRGHIFRYC